MKLKTLIAAKAGANAKAEEYKNAKQLCDECYSSEDYKKAYKRLERRQSFLVGKNAQGVFQKSKFCERYVVQSTSYYFKKCARYFNIHL